MSLSVPNPSIDLTRTQTAINNPTLSSGTNAGAVFNGRGNDFLDPNRIGSNVDGFSRSIRPVTSNTLTSQLAPGNPFGRNPDSVQVLNGTSGILNSILSPNFGANINFQVPIFPGPFIQPVPDLGINPDPTKIVLSSTFFAQNIQAPPVLNDPRNFNPLMWHNPNSSNILLGSLQAQSSVLNGSNLNFPPFNPFPTQSAVNFPSNPFQGSLFVPPPQSTQLPFGATSGFLPQANVGMNVGMNVGSLSAMSPMPIMMQPQLAGIGLQTSVFPIFAQQPVASQMMYAPMPSMPSSYSTAGSVSVQPYNSQIAVMYSMLNTLSAILDHVMHHTGAATASASGSGLYGGNHYLYD